MTNAGRLLIAAAALGVSIGCAAPGVVRGSSTTPQVSRAAGTALVFSDLGRPAVAVGVGTPLAPLFSAESEVRRLDLVERALYDLFDRSGVADRVIAAADLGPNGAGGPGFVVAYRISTFQELFHGPDGRYWAGYVLGSLTVGLGWLIAIDAHANFTHNYEFEVRVYDVRGVPTIRVPNDDGTFRNAYDTSVATQVMRRTYTGELRSWIGAGTTGPGGGDLDRFLGEQAAEVARTMFDLSAADVSRAIVRAAGEAPPVVARPPAETEPPAPSGAEATGAPDPAR